MSQEPVTARDSSVEPDMEYRAPTRPQLHFSGLDRLWGCGEQFRRIYIEKERQDANVAMMVGTAVDRSVSRNLGNKILDGSLLSLSEIEGIAADGFQSEWTLKDVVLTAEERLLGEKKVFGDGVDKAVRLARLHAKEIAPKIDPMYVARKWSIEIPGFQFDLVGEIDVQEKAGPRDTKTSGKTPAAGIADMSDQLSMYSLAIFTLDGVMPETVKLDYLIDNKTPVAKTFTSTRTQDDFRVLMNRVENAAEVIEKGAFTPAQPTDWRCSTKWCGFAKTCKFFKQPKSTVIDPGE